MRAGARVRGAFRISEKQEQANGVALLRTLGADVWVLGTRRRKGDFQGTNQTPGIPDVYALLARHLRDTDVIPRVGGRVPLWWEVKAVGGAVRPEQLHFATVHQASAVGYVRGTYDDLIAWLISAGVLKPENVPHHHLRQAPVASTVPTV